MAFGRDGSEIELHSLDLQNRFYRDALLKIISISKDQKIIKIAHQALENAGNLEKIDE